MHGTEIKRLKKRAHIWEELGMSVTVHEFLNERHNLAHPEHMHEFIEIAYVRSGSGVHTVNGTEYTVGRGSLLILDYNDVHQHVCDRDSSIINVLIDPAELFGLADGAPTTEFLMSMPDFAVFDGTDFSKPIIHFRDKERLRIEQLLDNMIAEYRIIKTGHKTVLRSQVSELFMLVLRKLSGVDRREFKLSPEFLDHIRQNCEQKFNLADLAGGCFYNPSYFSRLFHEHYGVTLTEFILNARYERACELLRNTTLSAEDIAARCGFGSKSSFYKMFKDRSGYTPREYRKK